MRPRSGPCSSPSSVIRSLPSIASPLRSSTASAASSAAIRARSSSSRPALAGSPDPTLSASRSASRSSSEPVAECPQLADEPPDRRVRPVRLVAEHVVADELDDPVAHGPRRVQPLEERLGQLGTDRVVTEEVAVGERRRLADVVEEGGQPNDRPRRRRRVDRSQRVVPQVLARDLVLGDAALRRELGARSARAARSRTAAGARPTASARPSSLSSSAAIRSPDRWATSSARVADPGQRRRLRPRTRASSASRTARIIRSASSSNRVAGSPTARRTRAPASSAPPYGSIERGRLARPGAPGHRVDREVAARQVELDRVAELDPVRAAEVGVVVVGPEGRDLEVLAVAPDRDRPEPVLVDGAREELDDLARAVRPRRGPSRPGRRPRTTSRSEPPTTYAA